jgi:hypothetical protein
VEANSTQLLRWMEFGVDMHVILFFFYSTFSSFISSRFQYIFSVVVLHGAIRCPTQQKVDSLKHCSGSWTHRFPLNKHLD